MLKHSGTVIERVRFAAQRIVLTNKQVQDGLVTPLEGLLNNTREYHAMHTEVHLCDRDSLVNTDNLTVLAQMIEDDRQHIDWLFGLLAEGIKL